MRRTNHRNLVNVGILSGRIPLISLVQFIAVAEHLNFRHAASHSVDRLKNSRCWSALAVCHHSGEALITYSTASTISNRATPPAAGTAASSTGATFSPSCGSAR